MNQTSLLEAPNNALSEPHTGFENVYVLVVAAGTGSRFGANIPKQYVEIAGQTILQHCIESLATSGYIKSVCLVISVKDEMAKQLNFSLPVQLVSGGAERWQSVLAGVNAIAEQGIEDNSLILIHDAARPCVMSKHIDAVIEAAMNEQYGATLGVPVVDTIKRIKKDDNSSYPYIQETVDRRNLWQSQTPQVFRASALQQVLNEVTEQNLSITDEASAFEVLNYPIRMVEGSRTNLKLTLPQDLALIEWLLTND